ncbi:DNA topoisomerase I [Candidatus Woesearchaeota archaeon]|nr:DNA topoisomerase I [Candidatus Woesearchaeota archaeon]
MVELIVSEKPSQAQKIAEALADAKPKKIVENKVSYYELTHNGKKILVGCAVGHLFNLREKNKKGWTYPVFDTEWAPSYELNKSSDFTKKYIEVLSTLAKSSNEFVVACDYDLEGSLIGYNVLRFIANKKDGKRMKFSTLTKEELQESYENAAKHLDFPLIESGEARHLIDWITGINLSRALTLSIKNATKSFKILSSGRVQGPALKVLAQRELEIQKFKPKPYWELEALGDINSLHKNGKFWEEKEVKKIYEKIKDEKSAIIKQIAKKTQLQSPPNPFDLTSLQLEAYRIFKINPKDSLAIAQSLYTKAYISYPRTSSNQFPANINLKSILQKLEKQKKYSKLIQELLSKNRLKPNNGKKTDPAHPPISPTGVEPKKLSDKENKIYDLIVRRTLATLAEPAKRESISVELDIKKEPFIATGIRTIEPGWHKFYGRYATFEEKIIPDIKGGGIVKIKKITLLSKETQPPKRYTPASIIKDLEQKNLGTKATRASIIDALYQRNYVTGQSIQVTNLGLKTVQTLEKYCPEILDEEMTRKLEQDMENIREKKETKENVLEKAEKHLAKILKHFKENELKIGKALSEANIETLEQESRIGQCPECKTGMLHIKRGKFGLFIACDRYEEGCKATFSIPSNALIKTTEKICKECSYPEILVIRRGKRPQSVCLNLDCKTKAVPKNLLEEKRKCPKCGSQLVIRKSLYGSFFSCPGYPKCRHIESIQKNNGNKKNIEIPK